MGLRELRKGVYRYIVGRGRNWNVVGVDCGELTTKFDYLETCAERCNG